jgi:chaperonin cofactor prefoldin
VHKKSRSLYGFRLSQRGSNIANSSRLTPFSLRLSFLVYIDRVILFSKEGNEVEQQTVLKEILKALDLYASDFRTQIVALNEKIETMDKKVETLDKKVEAIDKKVEAMNGELKRKFAEMDERIQEMDDRLESRIDRLENGMNERFNRLETKIDNLRIELIETQETVDFHSVKIAQHERKIRKLSQQQ